MVSETFTVRVDAKTKRRLAKLADCTGRSRSFLAAEAITEYLDANEWQIKGIKAALASIEQEGTIERKEVEAWVESWTAESELAPPKPTRP